MRSRHNTYQGIIWPALVVYGHTSSCVSCLFGKMYKIWRMTKQYCAHLSSISQTSLSLQNMSGQGAGGSGDTNWPPCAVAMLGWSICHLCISRLCLQQVETVYPFPVILHVSYNRSLIIYLSFVPSLLSLLEYEGIFHPPLHDLQTQESSLHVCWCLILVCTNVLRLPSSLSHFELLLTFVIK